MSAVIPNTEQAFGQNIFDARVAPQLGVRMPAVNEMLKRVKKVGGGLLPETALRYADTTTQWIAGAERWSLNQDDVHQKMIIPFWGKIAAPVVLPYDDVYDMDGGKSSKIAASVWTEQMAAAGETLKRKLSDAFIATAGTSTKTFIGLVDVMATTGSYGGISRSANSWWQPSIDSTTTLLVNFMKAIRNKINLLRDRDGEADLGLASPDVWDAIEDLEVNKEIHVVNQTATRNGITYQTGAKALVVSGCAIWREPAMNSGNGASTHLFILSTNHWDPQAKKSRYFWVKPPQDGQDSDTKVTAVIFRGQSGIFKKLASQGAFTALAA